jgi:hypothetical protein
MHLIGEAGMEGLTLLSTLKALLASVQSDSSTKGWFDLCSANIHYRKFDSAESHNLFRVYFFSEHGKYYVCHVSYEI